MWTVKERLSVLVMLTFFFGLVSAGSGNFTICPSGCDYANLSAFESGEESDLTGNGPAIAIITEGFVDEGTVTFNTWTTTEDDYVKITTNGSARHNGVWNDSAYILKTFNQDVIVIRDNYLTIDGLQILLSADSGTHEGISDASAAVDDNKIIISNNIIRGNLSGSASACSGIETVDGDENLFVYNNIIYDFTGGGGTNYGIYENAGTTGERFYYSNTVINCDRGIRGRLDNTYVKNNIAYNCSGADVYSELTGTNNAWGSSSLIGGTLTDNVSLVGILPSELFVDFDNDNFKIVPGAIVIDAGVDLSSDGNLSFGDDVVGASRPVGSAWDIGAFEWAGYKGVIPEDAGSPFYVNSSVLNNPYTGSCSDLAAGESCVLTWEVVPNGTVGASYEFFAFGESENYYAESQRVMVSIIGGTVVITLLNSTDFGVSNNESFVFSVNVSCPAGEEVCEALNLTLDPIVVSKLEEMGVDVGEVQAVVGGGVSVVEEEVGFFGKVFGFFEGLF
jgi:hypothetical protein